MFEKWFKMAPQERMCPAAEYTEMPVMADWDHLVGCADAVCDAIDQHLAYESSLQGRSLRPVTLCPEQKASLASDLNHLCL